MGSPQTPSPAQIAELEKAGQLQMACHPREIIVRDGQSTVNAELGSQGTFLFELTWDRQRFLSRFVLIQVPVLVRRYAYLLLKQAGEMLLVFKTQFIGDFVDGFVRIKDFSFRFIDQF